MYELHYVNLSHLELPYATFMKVYGYFYGFKNKGRKKEKIFSYLNVFPWEAKLSAISATNFLSFVGAPTMAVSAKIRADKMSNLDCVYFLSRMAKA